MQNFVRITSSANLVIPAGARLTRARLVATSGVPAVTAVLFNAATQGSAGDANDFLTLAINGNYDSDKENFGQSEGMRTQNGISVTITGTGAALYLYWI